MKIPVLTVALKLMNAFRVYTLMLNLYTYQHLRYYSSSELVHSKWFKLCARASARANDTRTVELATSTSFARALRIYISGIILSFVYEIRSWQGASRVPSRFRYGISGHSLRCRRISIKKMLRSMRFCIILKSLDGVQRATLSSNLSFVVYDHWHEQSFLPYMLQYSVVISFGWDILRSREDAQ